MAQVTIITIRKGIFMGIRILIVLIPLLTASCQTSGTVVKQNSVKDVNSKDMVTKSNNSSLVGSINSEVTPKSLSLKDSNPKSIHSSQSPRKSLLTKVKEKLLQQGLIQQKLIKQRLSQQKLAKQELLEKNKWVRKGEEKSKTESPPLWGYMNDEHRIIWNESNPYIRQSLTQYYSDPNIIQSIRR